MIVPTDGTRAANMGTGDFGTSPIFGKLSDKPLLASNQIFGVWGRKAQWRIEILMPTKKRFLWCRRRRPLVRPEVAAASSLSLDKET